MLSQGYSPQDAPKLLALLDDGRDHRQTLAERLIAALLAGARAGGDRRGTRSAAVIVCEPGRPRLALLVENEADPVPVLAYQYVMALAGAPPLRDNLPTPI